MRVLHLNSGESRSVNLCLRRAVSNEEVGYLVIFYIIEFAGVHGGD